MNKVYCRAYQHAFGLVIRHMKFKEPVQIIGKDTFYKIPDILKENQVHHPLIVASKRIIEGPFFKGIENDLKSYTVFSEIKSDPTLDLIEKMTSLYKETQCDSLIAIGGGSQIDAAKACGAHIVCPNKTFEQLGGTMHVRKKIPLFIAVPTTAGTGSECTVASVVTDAQTKHKYAINDPVLVPDYAVLDPNLTLSLTPFLTATTGMDALTHAIEAYLNPTYHQKDTKMLCEKAVVTIMNYLLIAYKNPSNHIAREKMLEASYQAGRAFTIACVGNVHATAHTLGGFYHVAHGLANAVILPVILEDYGSTVYLPLAKLARLCGIQQGNDEVCAKAFIQRIREMNEKMDILDYIDKIQEEDLEKMASYAAKEANPLYPVPVIFDEKHFIKILKKIGNLN